MKTKEDVFSIKAKLFLAQNDSLTQNIVDDYIIYYKEKLRHLSENQLNSLIDINKDLYKLKGSPKDINSFVYFKDLERLVDTHKSINSKPKKMTELNDDIEVEGGKLVYNQNGLEIYQAKTASACVKYGMGYSFCISVNDSSNMFNSYRFKNHQPIFYFIKDVERTKKEFDGIFSGLKKVSAQAGISKFNDKYHFFVIQVPCKTTENDDDKQYMVTSANNGDDTLMSWNEIVKINTKLKNIRNIFEGECLGKQEKDLYYEYKDINPKDIEDEFVKWDMEKKEMYFNIKVRGVKDLTVKMYKVLPEYLKKKYVGFGFGIDKEIFEEVKKDKEVLKYAIKTYKILYDKLFNDELPDNYKLQEEQILMFEYFPEYISKIDVNIVKKQPILISLLIDREKNIYPSIEMQEEAVNSNPYILKFLVKFGDNDILYPSEKIQEAAVKKYCTTIEYLVNKEKSIYPSEKIQEISVSKSGLVIKYLVDIDKSIYPSEKVQELAVKRDGLTIQYLIDKEKGIYPSEHIQELAILNDGSAIQYLVEFGEKEILYPSEKIQEIAVNRDSYIFKYLVNKEKGIYPSLYIQELAFKKDVNVIGCLVDKEKGIYPPEYLQELAVKRNGYTIQCLIDKEKGIYPSEHIQELAVKENANVIEKLVKFGEKEILYPSEYLQELAVSNNGGTIRYLVNKQKGIYPSEKIQYIAYKCSEEYFDRTILYVYLQEDLIPKFEELYKKGVKSL